MKADLFQSCGHCWVLQICWHVECNTFTASSFRTWNNSTGIPLPPLTLFVVMLSKAHLTSHSRMSGSRWLITPSWLTGLWRSFLYRSSVYSCHLFLISSASVTSYHFCPLLNPSLHEIFPWQEGREELLHIQGQEGQLWGDTPPPRQGAVAVLCWSSREEIPHVQGKRNPSKTVGVARGHQRAGTLKW